MSGSERLEESDLKRGILFQVQLKCVEKMSTNRAFSIVIMSLGSSPLFNVILFIFELGKIFVAIVSFKILTLCHLDSMDSLFKNSYQLSVK